MCYICKTKSNLGYRYWNVWLMIFKILILYYDMFKLIFRSKHKYFVNDSFRSRNNFLYYDLSKNDSKHILCEYILRSEIFWRIKQQKMFNKDNFWTQTHCICYWHCSLPTSINHLHTARIKDAAINLFFFNARKKNI